MFGSGRLSTRVRIVVGNWNYTLVCTCLKPDRTNLVTRLQAMPACEREREGGTNAITHGYIVAVP